MFTKMLLFDKKDFFKQLLS